MALPSGNITEAPGKTRSATPCVDTARQRGTCRRNRIVDPLAYRPTLTLTDALHQASRTPG
ncbi:MULTISPECIES: hypothetical protein [unclassified Stenotrophomonas]|uniref:hypothetical protein n=1 Tax=unclassified Stenotrophomonas TaxID=196198 RepID=UPI00211823B5|nr:MULTISPECIES: hypothetical protein [unclassified Stenotrophomonas]